MAKQTKAATKVKQTGAPKRAAKSVSGSTKPIAKKTNGSRSGSAAQLPKGVFITLEGGEGSGKSTQMKRLAKFLEEQGRTVVTTREPGGSPGAEAVRHVLLSGAAESFGAEMEAILFAAARGDHVDTVIAPALDVGNIVISDRFYDSTRVYQGVSGKVDADFVRNLEKISCGRTRPDLTIIIDVDPEEGMRRATIRRNPDEVPDRFEKESLDLQAKRRDAYLAIARDEPNRCVVIDGNGNADEVFEQVREAVVTYLNEAQVAASGKLARKTSVRKSKPKQLPHKKLTARKKPTSDSAKTPEGAGAAK